jgi:hypothetical protein
MNAIKSKINYLVELESTAGILILKRELVKGWKN